MQTFVPARMRMPRCPGSWLPPAFQLVRVSHYWMTPKELGIPVLWVSEFKLLPKAEPGKIPIETDFYFQFSQFPSARPETHTNDHTKHKRKNNETSPHVGPLAKGPRRSVPYNESSRRRQSCPYLEMSSTVVTEISQRCRCRNWWRNRRWRNRILSPWAKGVSGPNQTQKMRLPLNPKNPENPNMNKAGSIN
jgi:hypothetical protein